jgi:hypothetical protein
MTALPLIPHDAEGLFWLYGIFRAADSVMVDAPALPQSGVIGRIEVGALALLASAMPDVDVRRTRRNMLAHAKVLESALSDGPVLPMRFGVMLGVAAASAAAAAREAELLGHLARIEGRAEYGLRVSWPQQAAMRALALAHPALAERNRRLQAAGVAGQRALIDLGQEIANTLNDRRQSAQKALLRALVPLADDHVLRAPETDLEALRAEFLLCRSQEGAFLAAVQRAAEGLSFAQGPPDLRWVGPAPAYNFVNISLDAAQAA